MCLNTLQRHLLQKPETTLFIVILSSFFLKLILAIFVGFQVDEGSYMYDSYLITRGYIPFKDYTSRSPLFLLLLTVPIKLFGVGFLAGRLVIILFSTISVFFIYKIGKLLYNEKVGLLSAFIYAFSPVFLWWGFTIKNDPVENTFVICALYFFLLGIYKKRNYYFLINGVLLGLAVMVRKSAAIFIFSEPLFLYVVNSHGIFKIDYLKRKMAMACGGFLLAVMPFFIFFSYYIGPISTIEAFGEFSLFGGSSSPNFPEKDAVKIVRSLTEEGYYLIFPFIVFLYLKTKSVLEKEHIKEYNMMWVIAGFLYLSLVIVFNIVTVLFFLLFILFIYVPSFKTTYYKQVSFILAIIFPFLIVLQENTVNLSRFVICTGSALLAFFIYWFVKIKKIISSLLSEMIFVLLIFVSVIYLVADYTEGYSQLLTYMFVIMSAFVFVILVRELKKTSIDMVRLNFSSLFLMFWAGSVFVFYLFFPRWIDVYFINTLVPMTLGAAVFFKEIWSKIKDSLLRKALLFVVISSLLLTSTHYSFGTPDRHWSYRDIKDAADYIKENTKEEEEIFGSPEVAFYAERRLVLNLTHPALYRYSTPKFLESKDYPQVKEIIEYLEKHQVRYVVHTSYTEYCYYTTHKDLEDYIEKNYVLAKEFGDIRVLVRK